MYAHLVKRLSAKLFYVTHVKDFLRINDSFEDYLLDGFIDEATDWVEGETGRTLRLSSYEALIDRDKHIFDIELPHFPIQRVTDVHVRKGSIFEPIPFSMLLNNARARVFWTHGGDIKITYEAGYEEGCLPLDLKTAVLMRVGMMYHARLDEIHKGQYIVDRVISRYRSMRL